MVMGREPNFWLVKSEPTAYSWNDLVRDGSTCWDGVRNYEARNNLRAMIVGERILFYHSNVGKEIVGIAEVSREHYQDPTVEDDRWSAIDLKPVLSLKRPVTLATIKRNPKLQEIALVRRGRISVVPVTQQEFSDILEIANS